MAQGNPIPGEKYLHFKNKLYQIVAVAYHSETAEKFVVYQALYGEFKTYIRPYDMFISEVDHVKYPNVSQKWRFQLIEDLSKLNIQTTIEKPEAVAERRPTERTEAETGSRTTEKPEAEILYSAAQPASEPEEGVINPWLDKFLDADDFDEKYRIICDMYSDVTDRLIDDIAVVLDVTVPDGKLEDRYAQLKYCARTRQRYEHGRMQ